MQIEQSIAPAFALYVKRNRSNSLCSFKIISLALPFAMQSLTAILLSACAKLITGTNFRRGFLARLDAQDFCIEQARKLGIVSYVYDQVIRATVYRVDCTQTQVTGKAWEKQL